MVRLALECTKQAVQAPHKLSLQTKHNPGQYAHHRRKAI